MVEGFGEPFSVVSHVLGNLALVAHFLSSASVFLEPLFDNPCLI